MSATHPLPSAAADLDATSLRGEFVALARLALPLALANLLQTAVYAMDVIFIARLGTAPLAASTLATSTYGLSLWVSLGLIGAVAPMAATAIGRRRHAVREVRRSFRMALWLSVGGGLFVMAICMVADRFMRLTGQDETIVVLAREFLFWIAFAAIPVSASNVLRIFVSTMNRAIVATWVTVLALVVNGVGNWLLVFGNWGFPAWGLKGSAIASVFTAIVVLFAYVVIIQCDRRMRRHYIFGRIWRPDWQRLRELLRIGLPIGAITLAEGGLFSGAAYLVGMVGTLELGAHTVALGLGMICFQVPFGIAQASTIRVGLHQGAGEPAGIRRTGIAALVLTVSFAAVFAAAMLGAPRLLLSLYVDVDDPANASLVAMALSFLLLAAAFQLFDGAQTVLAGLLRGLSDTRMPLIHAIVGYWGVGFTLSWYLAFHTTLGGIGVWVGLAISLVVTSALLGQRWVKRDRLGLVAPQRP